MTSAAGGLTLLRVVPREGALHRLDPRTKIAALVVLILTVSFRPSWAGLGAIAATIVFAGVIGGIPWSARPRLPRVFLIGIGVSLGLSVIAGGDPVLASVGSWDFGAGGLLAQLRFLAVTVVILALTHLLGWTTSMTALPPAAAWFLRPLRVVRLPVDELATALALAVRALPLLLDEMSIAAMVWRRRPRVVHRGGRRRVRALAVEIVDVMGTVTSSTVRRSMDLGDTLERRGLDAPRAMGGFGRRDLVAASIVGATVVVIALLPPA